MVTVTATSSATFRPVRNSWIGLCVALFALPLIRQVFRVINPAPGTGLLTLRELLMFASAAGLLVLVNRGEKLPFTSVGLGAAAWWKSILWGLLAAVVCGGAAVIMVKVLRLSHEGSSATLDRSPLWLVTLIIFRAGMVEESFYRGYAIERFRAMGWGKLVSAAIPLVIFAAAHYTGGVSNVAIALVMGGLLSGFFLWRRDLVACMFARLIDFLANVVPRLGS